MKADGRAKNEKGRTEATFESSLVTLLIRDRGCRVFYPRERIEIKNALAVGETAGRFDYRKLATDRIIG